MKVEEVKKQDASGKMPPVGQVPNPAELSAGCPDIEVVEIPSKFLPYPKDSIIYYRPYTYGELLKLNQSNLGRIAKFEFMLQGISTSFEKDSLALFDFIYICTLRKLSTLKAPEFVIKYTCQNCEATQIRRFSLQDIETKDLEVPELPVAFTLESGIDLELSTLSVGSYLKLLKAGEEQDRLKVYAHCVTNLPFDEAYAALDKASGEDLEILKEVDEMLFIGLEPFECVCSNCGHITPIDIKDDSILIEPFRGEEVSARSKIRFGVQKHS